MVIWCSLLPVITNRIFSPRGIKRVPKGQQIWLSFVVERLCPRKMLTRGNLKVICCKVMGLLDRVLLYTKCLCFCRVYMQVKFYLTFLVQWSSLEPNTQFSMCQNPLGQSIILLTGKYRGFWQKAQGMNQSILHFVMKSARLNHLFWRDYWW